MLGVLRSVCSQVRIVPDKIPHANRSFLRLGQGPPDAGGIGHGASRQNDLFARAWFQTCRSQDKRSVPAISLWMPSWRNTQISPLFSAIETAAPPRSSVASTSGCR